MQNSLIKVVKLKKYYKKPPKVVKALKSIDLTIFKGEIISLLGVNGAGKTTLSSILSTLHPPTSGDILYNNTSIYKDITEYRKIVGYCPQKPNLIQDLNVEQNLYLSGAYYGLPKKVIKERVDQLVRKYNLEQYLKSDPSVLSGGYKQRVLIARSLVHNPQLIILDEPTVGLDPHIRHQLWDNIKQLKREGVTVLLTTHYLDEAEVLSDRICILDKGVIKLVDTPQNLKDAYQKSRLEEVFIQLMQEESEEVL